MPMIFFDHTNWYSLSDAEKNCLWFLRGIRDAMAKDLLADLGYYKGDKGGPVEWMEDVVTLKSRGSGQRLRGRFLDRDDYRNAERIDLLEKICRRIGRLELERCGKAIPHYLIIA